MLQGVEPGWGLAGAGVGVAPARGNDVASRKPVGYAAGEPEVTTCSRAKPSVHQPRPSGVMTWDS